MDFLVFVKTCYVVFEIPLPRNEKRPTENTPQTQEKDCRAVGRWVRRFVFGGPSLGARSY